MPNNVRMPLEIMLSTVETSEYNVTSSNTTPLGTVEPVQEEEQPINVSNETEIRRIIAELFALPADEITFVAYIGECQDKIREIISDSNYYDLIAPTGSGKTTAILDYAVANDTKMIYLVPLRANVIQLASDESYKGKVGAIYDSVSASDACHLVDHFPVIISTYDGIQKLEETEAFEHSEYVLCLDEYHNFVTMNNYRYEPIRAVMNSINKFKKYIRVTGTPEGVVLPDDPTTKVRFARDVQVAIIGKYNIVTYWNRPLESVARHIVAKEYTGKVVVLINNIEFLNDLKKRLIGQSIESNRIAVIHSDVKKSDDYTFVTEKKSIRDETQYLLTTSVISDGVSILNENVNAVYVLNINNPLLIRQSVARFRQGVENVYDFMLSTRKREILIPKMSSVARAKQVVLDQIVSALNDYKGSEQLTPIDALEMIEGLLGAELKALCPIYFDPSSNIYKVDNKMVDYEALEQLHRIIMKHPSVRGLYMNMFESYDVGFESLDETAEDLSPEAEKEVILETLRRLSGDRDFLRKARDLHLTKLKRLLRRLYFLLDPQKREICMTCIRKLDMTPDIEIMECILANVEADSFISQRNLASGYYGTEVTPARQKEFTTLINDVFVTQASNKVVRCGNDIYRGGNLHVLRRRIYSELFDF